MKRLVLLLVIVVGFAPAATAVQDCPAWDPDCAVQHGPDPVKFPYPQLQVGDDHPYVPVIRAHLYQHGHGGLEDLASTVYDTEVARDVARFQWLWMRDCAQWNSIVYCNHDGFDYGVVNLLTLQRLTIIRITGDSS